MKLIICEKPSVAKDIAKVLKVTQRSDGFFHNSEYQITWAFGHLVQLINPDDYDAKYKKWTFGHLPIIPDTFKKTVVQDSGAQKQFHTIQTLLTQEKLIEVICATDAGREGELIFRLIYEQSQAKAPIKRLWISSQTDKAIKAGFQDLRAGSDYEALFHSAISRSEADWLIGMNASRAYSIQYSAGKGVMSVGRVQTPVLNLIVTRYRENIAFVPQTFYEVFSDIVHPNGTFRAKWFKDKSDRMSEKAEAEKVVARLTQQPNGIIQALTSKNKNEKPPLLYDLTELQRDANKKFKFSADKTLKLMQSLYETHKVLTYPRTNSRYLSSDIVPQLKGLFENLSDVAPYDTYADQVLSSPIKPGKRIVDDSKVTDHHAIIPTDKKASLSALSADERQIFDLVVRRFLAAFFPECKKTITEIVSLFGEDTLKASGTIIQEVGWRALYQEKQKGKKETEILLPKVEKKEAITAQQVKLNEGQTKAPPLYNEASILSAMETAGKEIEDEALREAIKECGIGTPATRAQILERLISVGYIVREKNRLSPTDKGLYLIDHIQNKALLSPELTGEWEKKLNDMALGQYERKKFMSDIESFTEDIIDNVKEATGWTEEEKNLGKCPVCEKGDVKESQRAYSCSEHEKSGCEFIIWKMIAGQHISPDVAQKLIDEGKTEVIKDFKSKAGKSFDASLALEDGKAVFKFEQKVLGTCPLCKEGEVVETPKAYSCSKWRETNCGFAIWKEIAKRQISEEEAKEILENGQTNGELDGFVSRAGKPFAAQLILKENKVQFNF